MGILDFFKKKTVAEKNAIYFEKLRRRTSLQEKKSLMHDLIVSTNHDNSYSDQHPNAHGEFGLEKSNPIPIYGIDNIPIYMDKLRYKYTSISGSGQLLIILLTLFVLLKMMKAPLDRKNLTMNYLHQGLHHPTLKAL